MSGSKGFAVTITAVDRASKYIDGINRKIASMRAPADRVQKSLAKFADVSGLAAIDRGMQKIAQSSLAAFRSVSRIVEPLAAITGAASVAGLVRLTTAFGDFGSSLEYAARRIGITSDQLQALQGAARLSGSSAGALTSGMRTLGDTLVDAVAGRAPEAVVMLNTLGISFRDSLTGGARTAIDVLPELADKIARIKNPTLQARVATTLLGGAAEELLPFLRRGSAGIAEYTEMARKYGVINEQGAQKAIELRQAQTALELSVQGLTNAIGEQFAPILGPLLKGMADWIAANRDWIATQIAEKVKELRDYLKSIDWTQIGHEIWTVVGYVKEAVDAFGGVQRVTEGLLTYMVTKWVVGMVASVVQVTTAVGTGLVGAFNLAKAAAFSLNAEMQSNPTFRTLTLLLQLYDKLQGGIDLKDVPPESPLWNAVPPEQQRNYPNSPVNQPHGGAGSWWQNHAPTWLGGRKQSDLAPDIEAAIREGARARGLNENHMVALAKEEHGGYHNVSPAGAIGPMQLMPGTARDLGVNPNDWRQNIAGGLDYYKRQLERYGGNYAIADAAYNAGPDNPGVRTFAYTGDLGVLPPETQRYVRDISTEDARMAPSALGAPATIGGGAGASAGAVTHTVEGSADVNVNIVGAPAGSSATATGGGILSQPRISLAMPGLGP